MSSPYRLIQFTSTDNLVLHGLLFTPQTQTKTALIWIHGLSSNFYSHVEIMNELAFAGETHNFAFLTFNNRGHDYLSSNPKSDPSSPKGYTRFPGGAGREIFEDCIHDLQGAVNFLTNLGFNQLIFIGHSTGANKLCYYLSTQKPRFIKAAILASPLSDRLVPNDQSHQINQTLNRMKKFIAHPDSLAHEKLFTEEYFYPVTARRFISLFDPSSSEQMFDYDKKNPRMPYFSDITLPLLVIHGESDEHADRPISQIQSAFSTTTKSKKYTQIILPQALHSFGGKEKLFVNSITQWLKSIN